MNRYLKFRYVAKIICSLVANYLLIAALIILLQVLDASINGYDITYMILRISLMWIILFRYSSIIFVGFLIWKIWKTHMQYYNEKLMCMVMEEYLEGKKSWESLMDFIVEGDCRKVFRSLVNKRGYRSYENFVEKYRLNRLRYVLDIKPDKKKTKTLLLEYEYDNCFLATNNMRVQERTWSDEQKLDPEELKYGIAIEWLILSNNNLILGKAGFYNFSGMDENRKDIHVYIDLNDDIIEMNGIDQRKLIEVLVYHFKEAIGKRELNLDSLCIDRNTEKYDEIFINAGFRIYKDMYLYRYDLK